MFLYLKKHEGAFQVYDLKTKRRYIISNAILIGFILFIFGIKLSSANPYAIPLFLIGLLIIFPSLIIAVVESVIILKAKIASAEQTIPSSTRPKTEIWVAKK